MIEMNRPKMPDQNTADLFELSFVELHSSMFHCGKNFKEKVSGHTYPGVKLFLDRAHDEVQLWWNGIVTYLPKTSVLHMTPAGQGEKKPPAQVVHPMVLGTAASAQVETPFGHVHAGPGQGKSGKK